MSKNEVGIANNVISIINTAREKALPDKEVLQKKLQELINIPMIED